MLSRFNSRGLLAAVIILCACNGSLVHSQSERRDLREEDSTRPSPSGQKTFASTCAPCHGLDGRGGKTAPNIARNAKLEHLSDAEISAVVARGIPGTGMPAFRSLSSAEVHAVVNYLRILQGHNRIQKLPGDSTRGKTVFFEKGACSTCHVMLGEGGFAGPDLTIYGADRSAKEIANAITHPKNNADGIYKLVTVVNRDGQRFRGSIRNEDNFSLQLQAVDGSFYFLLRSDVNNLEYEEHSVMPAEYGKRLSQTELNDLVSYLMSAGGSGKTGSAPR
jgi:cytochrome c oxidase cbb3-type subunit III